RGIGAAEEMVDMAVRLDIAISERAPVRGFGHEQDPPVRAAGEETDWIRHCRRPGGDLRRAVVARGNLMDGGVEQAGQRRGVGRTERADADGRAHAARLAELDKVDDRSGRDRPSPRGWKRVRRAWEARRVGRVTPIW